MAESFDVIVVGAGMAGLAMASALRTSPLRVAVIEPGALPAAQAAAAESGQQASVEDFDPRVSALTASSINLLQQLGAWSAVTAQRHCLFARMQVWDAAGTAALDFTAEEVGGDQLGCIVENKVSQQALYGTVSAASNIQFFNPAKLLRLRSAAVDGSRQLAELDDGTELSAQLIVAADGGNSQLRRLAGFDLREWSYQQLAIVTTVRTSQPHQHTAWQSFLPQGPLAFLPLAGDSGHYSSIVWSADTDCAQQLLALDDTAFRQALQQAFEHRLGEVLEVSRRFSFPLRQKHATNYIKPGIALVGDAAHVIHPLAGQGANLGLQDVQALSAELLQAHGDGLGLAHPHHMQRYQRRRKADNLAMMAAVEGLKRLFGSQQLPARWVRNAGMRQLTRIKPLQQQIIRHAMGL